MTLRSSEVFALTSAAVVLVGAILRLRLRRRCADGQARAAMNAPARPPSRRYVALRSPVSRDAPTAVLIVGGYTQAGVAMLEEISRDFAGYYKNLVFLSLLLPEMEWSGDSRDLEDIRTRHEDDLESYVPLARGLGLNVEVRTSLGLLEFEPVCRDILTLFPRACFVLSRTPSPNSRFMVSTLPEETTRRIRSDLAKRRLPFIDIAVSLPAEATG